MSTLVRKISATDAVISRFDHWLRGIRPQSTAAAARPNPGAHLPEAPLGKAERRKVGALMRVNHAGEVCAQALYHGQAATARTPALREHMLAAAEEEADHLDWCAGRLRELGDHTSYLDPLWYTGSYVIGSAAGLAGDRWSLGFIAETERQVEQHLEGHRRRLAQLDRRSRAIVDQIQQDEVRHGQQALAAGGSELPLPVRLAMRLTAKVMTTTAHWI